MLEAAPPNPLRALIEEAWRRARRRRMAVVVLMAIAAASASALYLLAVGGGGARTKASSPNSRPAVRPLPGTARAPIENPSALALWTRRRGLIGSNAGVISFLRVDRLSVYPRTRTRQPVLSLQTVGRETAIAQLGTGRYLRSDDAGRHWHPFPLRYPTSFATPTVGLAYRFTPLVRRKGGGWSNTMQLLYTKTGGRTWTLRPAPCGGDPSLVDLVTPRLGWLMCLGQGGAGNEAKLLYRTNDGGRTWHSLVRVLMMPGEPGGSDRSHGLTSYGYPQGISFARDGFGLLWESRGTLYVTRDGGSHWIAEPKVARPEEDFGYGGAALSNGRGFVLLSRGGGPNARLLETRDYGRTWRGSSAGHRRGP